MSLSLPSRPFGRLTRTSQAWVDGYNKLDRQAQFYAKTIGSMGHVFLNYRIELVRVIAGMSLGQGALPGR